MSLSLDRACYGTTLAHVSCQPSNESYTQHHRFHILLHLKIENVNSFYEMPLHISAPFSLATSKAKFA